MSEAKLIKKKPKRLSADLSAQVIEALGGTVAVAGLCGIEPPSVSEWKTKGITRPYLLFLRERFSTIPVMKRSEIANF